MQTHQFHSLSVREH